MTKPDRFGQVARKRYLERGVIFIVVVTGHILLAALLCLQIAPPPVTQAGADGAIVTVNLVSDVSTRAPLSVARTLAKSAPVKATSSEQSVASKDVLPPDITGLDAAMPEVAALSADDGDSIELTEADAVALAAFEPAPSQGAPGVPCDLTQNLATLFAQSPVVQQGLAGLPQADRSVANAVMLWDGQWTPESRVGGRALLRALLTKAVSVARADCLMAVNRGPVLFLVPDRQATVVLAIGSGQWRWNDLLEGNALSGNNLIATNFYSLPSASKIPGTP